MKNFVAKMDDSSQERVLRKVCSSKQYAKVLAMAEDGYEITGDILELLYRLGHKDIVKKLFYQTYRYFDESAEDFLINLYGEKAYEDMLKKRRQQLENRIVQLANKCGLNKKVLDEAENTGTIPTLLAHFGEDAVCKAILKNGLFGRYEYKVDDPISLECWCRHGCFVKMQHKLYMLLKQYEDPATQKAISIMNTLDEIPGVVKELYKRADQCGQYKVILTWLGKYHREVFFAEASEWGYRHAFYYGNMTQEEWEQFYEHFPDRAVKCAIDMNKYEWLRQKGLKWPAFKAALTAPFSHWFGLDS